MGAREGLVRALDAATEFAARIAELRAAHLAEQRELIGSAVDDFFLYDEVLETALMLGRPAGRAGRRAVRAAHRPGPRHRRSARRGR